VAAQATTRACWTTRARETAKERAKTKARGQAGAAEGEGKRSQVKAWMGERVGSTSGMGAEVEAM